VGVYCAGSSAPTIAGCIVKNNQYGIFCSGAGQVKIINNWIVNNGYYGIYITTSNELTIRNNTISKNNSAGIYRAGGTDPNISNSIFWYNGSSHTTDFVGTFTKVNYCRISAERPGSTGNILSDPCFVDVNAGNYHIKAVSLCRNAGDPNTTLVSGETDIDGQPRRNGTARAVDIGADEYYGGSDLNGDGQVNFLDYAIFANAWKTYQGSAKWNAACDFIDDNDINNLDLAWFAQAWPFPPAGQQQSMMQQTEPEALEHFSSTL
jgi:parallel beta-helix repeat protein